MYAWPHFRNEDLDEPKDAQTIHIPGDRYLWMTAEGSMTHLCALDFSH